jgi:peptidyl-prolyl cis-trans isomerase D
MAKDSEDTPRKKGKGSQIVVWILMVMLVAGLGGFGITNFGGGVTTIGKVGTREITATAYARALQQELAALTAQFGQNVTFSQAQAFGVDRNVLQQLVAQAALDDEAARAGLSVGDARVAAEIAGTAAFSGAAGGFDRESYRFALDRANLSEAEFETGLRSDLTRQLLTGAVAGGFTAPAAVTDTLYAYVAERRAFSLLRLTEADLAAEIPAPTDADLQAYYDANMTAFTAPEAKRITYAALLPETIAADQPIDESALRTVYDGRIAEFVQPEKRLVERLVYPDTAAAEAARARLDAGTSFETLVAERGLSLDDIDLGDVGRTDLGAAADAVFGLDGPGVVGPFDSALGPALFRMNAILAAQETTFEQAQADLAAEVQTDAARRAIGDLVEGVDDALAEGSTLEDLARDQGMELATIDYVSAADSPIGIAAYPKFRQAADALAEGDFPEAVLLEDGGLVALRLDAIVPPTPIPFDAARDAVAGAWAADQMASALAARAIEIKAQVEGGTSLGSFGIVERTAAIARDGFVENTPPGFLADVFAMDAGEMRVIEGPGFTGLLVMDTVTAPDAEGDAATALKSALAAQVEQAISQDALSLFTNALTAEAGITLDQNAINAVHAQFN